jgi:spore coat polysaccharide biosynthesis protein SpsF (cytidylyltransferase family)
MICAILQARMGSTRLPGKVLTPIAGKALIAHMTDRLKKSRYVSHFIVATTTNPEDDALAKWCEESGIPCFRGSDWDVLDRFYQACVSLPETPQHVVRICCDNPLHHHATMDEVIRNYFHYGVDYCSNSNYEPLYLEDGFDTEICSFAALEKAWTEAKMLSEREHVTPYIKQSPAFSKYWRKTNDQYTFKLSVDTESDRLMTERIFGSFPDPLSFDMKDVIYLLQSHPEIRNINKESSINEGYAKSLREDRQVYE